MTDTPAASPRALLLGALATALLAALFLGWARRAHAPERLHVHGSFNDQAGYVTTARVLADTGELRSGLVYPSRLERPDWRPYMPGHYWALAAAYRLLGYGVGASLLPSFVAFVLAAAGLYLAVARLAGPLRGGVAASLFALFPGNVAYASTAMAETTFTAAGVVAFAAFVLAPVRLRPLFLPALLALPFLFRETGALLVLPLLVLMLHEDRRPRRLLLAGASLVASVLLLSALQAWQVAEGKGAPTLEWVNGEGFNYDDAVAPEPEELGASAWLLALGRNVVRNVGTTERWLARGLGPMGTWETLVLLACILALLVRGLRPGRTAPLARAGAVLGVVALVFTYALYDTPRVKLMRGLLYTTPFLAAGLAELPVPAVLRRTRLRVALGLAAGFVLLLLASRAVGRATTRVLTSKDGIVERFGRELAALEPPPDGLLVSPHDVSLDFVVTHYPVRWSFVPANDATLRELDRKAGPIELLVLREGKDEPSLDPAALAELGLRRERAFLFQDERYVVHRRQR